MLIVKDNFDEFASIMAYGMDLAEYNRDCFSTNDILLCLKAKGEMGDVGRVMREAGYSPHILNPYLEHFCEASTDRFDKQYSQVLKANIDDAFRVDVDVSLYHWFEEWFHKYGRTVARINL